MERKEEIRNIKESECRNYFSIVFVYLFSLSIMFSAPRRSEQWRRVGHGVRTWDPAEKKAATEPHHVLWRPTGGAGAGLPEDAVPGRLHTRGTSTEVSHVDRQLSTYFWYIEIKG